MDAEDLEQMSLAEKLEHIKTRVSPLDVAEMAGCEVDGDKIRSPYNESDATPSCHLYPDHFWDFSTGRGGDVIDLYMAFTESSWGQAVNRLMKGVQALDADPDRVRRVPKPEPVDFFQAFTEVRSEDYTHVISGLAGWYLPQLVTLGQLKTTKHHLVIPHWVGSKIPAVKLRTNNGSKSCWPGSQFLSLYGPRVSSYAMSAIIMEGESDCWAMDAHLNPPGSDINIAVFALPSGAGLWRNEWLDALAGYKKIGVCFDNDHAGKAALYKVTHAIGWGRAVEITVPTLINDAREALSRGWEPNVAQL